MARLAREAALASTDPERLLLNETADSNYLEDARHWVGVYTELVAGKARILDQMLQELERSRHPAVRDELDKDQIVMLSELDRFNRRLQFWQRREIELNPNIA